MTTANACPAGVGVDDRPKATNFASHPGHGGIPASENRKTDISTASEGAYSNRPPKLFTSALPVFRATAITTVKAPRFIAA